MNYHPTCELSRELYAPILRELYAPIAALSRELYAPIPTASLAVKGVQGGYKQDI